MMSQGTVAQPTEREKRRRAKLAGQCREYRVTNTAIAERADVDRSMVSHWFAARYNSERVEAAVIEALAEAKAA